MMHALIRSRLPYGLKPSRGCFFHGTPPTGKTPRRSSRRKLLATVLAEDGSESEIEGFSEQTREEYARLEAELQRCDDLTDDFAPDSVEDQEEPSEPSKFPEYRIRHRFIGFDPRYMDLEDFPRIRTDFDGKQGEYQWMGTECQKCGLQIRRERRTNRETSLNVYAHPGIPDDLLRHCPEQKSYPVLWRTRDPYVALDVLAVEDY